MAAAAAVSWECGRGWQELLDIRLVPSQPLLKVSGTGVTVTGSEAELEECHLGVQSSQPKRGGMAPSKAFNILFHFIGDLLCPHLCTSPLPLEGSEDTVIPGIVESPVVGDSCLKSGRLGSSTLAVAVPLTHCVCWLVISFADSSLL